MISEQQITQVVGTTAYDVDGDKLGKVKNAPKIDTDGHLSPQEEQELYRYYGLGNGTDTTVTDTTGTAGMAGVAGTTGRTDHAGEPGVVGRDTSGPTTDNAMTRSEERLSVGTSTEAPSPRANAV